MRCVLGGGVSLSVKLVLYTEAHLAVHSTLHTPPNGTITPKGLCLQATYLRARRDKHCKTWRAPGGGTPVYTLLSMYMFYELYDD